MQMSTVNYTLRVDETDKKDVEAVFKELGMTFSTGINIYLKAVKRQKKIPFELTLDTHTDISTVTGGKVSKDDKQQAFIALDGILAGHEVDLDSEREERILS